MIIDADNPTCRGVAATYKNGLKQHKSLYHVMLPETQHEHSGKTMDIFAEQLAYTCITEVESTTA